MPEAGLRYAQALRATDQRAQAVAVLEQASIRNPGRSWRCWGAYGRALAEAGELRQGASTYWAAHIRPIIPTGAF